MAYPVEWSMDPPHHEWAYDADTHAIVATTTTVVHTHFYLGRIFEEEEPEEELEVQLAPADVTSAHLGLPLGPWDFPLEPLPDIEMEPMSPGLPAAEPMPLPEIPVINVSSTATPRAATASPPLPMYHPTASEEDLSEERSSVGSYTPGRRIRRIEVITRHPRIIRTPHVPRGRGRGARGTRHSRT